MIYPAGWGDPLSHWQTVNNRPTTDWVDSDDAAYGVNFLIYQWLDSSDANNSVVLASPCLGEFDQVETCVYSRSLLSSNTQGRRAGPPYRARDTPV